MAYRKPKPPRAALTDRTGRLAAEWLRYLDDLGRYLDELTNAVMSVFGRTGVVVAGASDYDASQVDNDSGVAGATVKAALDTLKANHDTLAQRGRWVAKTAAYTAATFERVLADTSGGAFTLTLPAAPQTGDEVLAMDAKGTFASANLTVGGNGKTIMGTASQTLSTANVWRAYVYNGSEWRERA